MSCCTFFKPDPGTARYCLRSKNKPMHQTLTLTFLMCTTTPVMFACTPPLPPPDNEFNNRRSLYQGSHFRPTWFINVITAPTPAPSLSLPPPPSPLKTDTSCRAGSGFAQAKDGATDFALWHTGPQVASPLPSQPRRAPKVQAFPSTYRSYEHDGFELGLLFLVVVLHADGAPAPLNRRWHPPFARANKAYSVPRVVFYPPPPYSNSRDGTL